MLNLIETFSHAWRVRQGVTPSVQEETPSENNHQLRETANQVLRGVTLALIDDSLTRDPNGREELRPRDHRHQEDLMAPHG